MILTNEPLCSLRVAKDSVLQQFIERSDPDYRGERTTTEFVASEVR